MRRNAGALFLRLLARSKLQVWRGAQVNFCFDDCLRRVESVVEGEGQGKRVWGIGVRRYVVVQSIRRGEGAGEVVGDAVEKDGFHA